MAEIFTKIVKIPLPATYEKVNVTLLKDELRDLMETLDEQFETLMAYEGKVPHIEFDIILENTRKFYEYLTLLHRLNDSESESLQPVQENREMTFIIKPDLPATPMNTEKEPPEEKGNSTVAEKKEPEDTPVNTLFTFEDTGFSQKLKEARERTLGTGFRQTNPGDLKILININDKFLFINELFDGNLREYSKAIDSLNSMHEKRDAIHFMDELISRNLWDAGSEAFRKLKEVVEKKFE